MIFPNSLQIKMNYNQFAWYYDSLMEPQFYEDYFHFICEKATFNNILDLGCGTGRFDAMIASSHHPITAVDLSNQMIAVAKETIKNTFIDFKVGDMKTYKDTKKYDLVLCICDSLNYVLGFEEQIKVLKNAYQQLNQNGTFIFDIHSQYKINELFKNYSEEQEDDDFYFYWTVKKTDPYQITHYVVIEDLNEEIRVEEKHIQESYPIEWYINALKEIGFESIEFSETFQENQRVVFIAKK